jgi:hypothetical protein
VYLPAVVDVSPEEEEEIVDRAAHLIHRTGLDAAAILALESFKPMMYVGGQMGRIVFTPILFLLGGKTEELGDKLFTVFEKTENVERLIRKLEEIQKSERD